MESFLKSVQRPLIWLLLILFVIFYPMLISIYVFLPLFIGLIGYMLIVGIEKERWRYILVASIYFVNLEANLSLPFFLTLIATLLVYVLFYHHLRYFRRCVVCVPMIIVFLIDLFYLLLILGYDFIFQTQSIVLDTILLYSLIADMLMVVILV
jgi:hypothetical protein